MSSRNDIGFEIGIRNMRRMCAEYDQRMSKAVLAKRGINIERQVLDTRSDFGYAIYEINQTCDESLIGELEQHPQTIRVRVTPGFR